MISGYRYEVFPLASVTENVSPDFTVLDMNHWTKIPDWGPQVLTLIPVLVLGGARFHVQKLATNTAGLVDCQPVFDPALNTVNDLRPRLCLNDLVGTRKTMMFEFSVLWRNPLELSAKLDALLLVDNSVMKYARHSSAVTLS